MMPYHLKPYQGKAVYDETDGLLTNTLRFLKSDRHQRLFVLKSIMGSGKTVIASEFIRVLLKSDDPARTGKQLCIIWLSKGSAGLHMQSSEKLEKNISAKDIHIYGIRESSDFNAERFYDKDVYVINWEKLNNLKNGELVNNLFVESENKNLRLAIQNSRDVEYIFIIDEFHLNYGTESYRKILEFFNPHVIIGMSATPTDEQMSLADSKYSIPVADVIEEGMVKKGICFNTASDYTDDEISEYNTIDEFFLKLAIRQRDLLETKYRKEGSDVIPLLLIQFNDDKSNEDIWKVKEILDREYHNNSYNTYAIWISEADNKKDKLRSSDSIISNLSSNKVRILLFKQAVATGWDCPRAQVLLRYRRVVTRKDAAGISSFDIQTLGRIFRMPEPERFANRDYKHYEDEDLNYGYVFVPNNSYELEKGFKQAYQEEEEIFRKSVVTVDFYDETDAAELTDKECTQKEQEVTDEGCTEINDDIESRLKQRIQQDLKEDSLIKQDFKTANDGPSDIAGLMAGNSDESRNWQDLEMRRNGETAPITDKECTGSGKEEAKEIWNNGEGAGSFSSFMNPPVESPKPRTREQIYADTYGSFIRDAERILSSVNVNAEDRKPDSDKINKVVKEILEEILVERDMRGTDQYHGQITFFGKTLRINDSLFETGMDTDLNESGTSFSISDTPAVLSDKADKLLGELIDKKMYPRETKEYLKKQIKRFFRKKIVGSTYSSDSAAQTSKLILLNEPVLQRLIRELDDAIRELSYYEFVHAGFRFPRNFRIPPDVNEKSKGLMHLPLPRNSSEPELIFEKILNEPANQVLLWYKNADHGASAFCVPYKIRQDIRGKTTEREMPTYPDFIVLFKDGSVGIYEIKDYDKQDQKDPLKSSSIDKLVSRMNRDGNKVRIYGGLLYIDQETRTIRDIGNYPELG